MQQFHIFTDSQHVDDISNELLLLGADSITLLDAADHPRYEPLPGEIILWPKVVIVALVADKNLLIIFEKYLAKLQSAQRIDSFYLEKIPAKDWVRASLDQFKPMTFGKRLWICPSWCTPPEPLAVNVMLDPGLAFGTGMHPTTNLCLCWLDENIHGGEVIIDYGCGSGILAIAAIKLGAMRALAIDHDPQALEATQMNAEVNGIDDQQLTLASAQSLGSARVDIIIANILSNPLIELAPHFANLLKPNGKIVLSGILQSQVTEVINCYQQWFAMAEPVFEGEWARLEGCMDLP